MGKRLEVAVAIGAEPALCYAATAPMPEGLDELLLAGFLARRRIELVKARTVDLEVPATAEYVIEGVKTTIPFHQQLLKNEDFKKGNFTTKFMESFKMY